MGTLSKPLTPFQAPKYKEQDDQGWLKRHENHQIRKHVPHACDSSDDLKNIDAEVKQAFDHFYGPLKWEGGQPTVGRLTLNIVRDTY